MQYCVLLQIRKTIWKYCQIVLFELLTTYWSSDICYQITWKWRIVGYRYFSGRDRVYPLISERSLTGSSHSWMRHKFPLIGLIWFGCQFCKQSIGPLKRIQSYSRWVLIYSDQDEYIINPSAYPSVCARCKILTFSFSELIQSLTKQRRFICSSFCLIKNDGYASHTFSRGECKFWVFFCKSIGKELLCTYLL